MRRLTILTLASLLSSAGPAWADRIVEQPEDAYEVSLGSVTFPPDARGWVVFTTCDGCPTTTLRVTDETRYFVNDAQVTLLDLKEAATDLRGTTDGRENAGVIIFFDVASRQVNRLALRY